MSWQVCSELLGDSGYYERMKEGWEPFSVVQVSGCATTMYFRRPTSAAIQVTQDGKAGAGAVEPSLGSEAERPGKMASPGSAGETSPPSPASKDNSEEFRVPFRCSECGADIAIVSCGCDTTQTNYQAKAEPLAGDTANGLSPRGAQHGDLQVNPQSANAMAAARTQTVADAEAKQMEVDERVLKDALWNCANKLKAILGKYPDKDDLIHNGGKAIEALEALFSETTQTATLPDFAVISAEVAAAYNEFRDSYLKKHPGRQLWNVEIWQAAVNWARSETAPAAEKAGEPFNYSPETVALAEQGPLGVLAVRILKKIKGWRTDRDLEADAEDHPEEHWEERHWLIEQLMRVSRPVTEKKE